ncbi:MAG: glycosyltransferase family 4 protein [Candidatus Binatia bacterium]|jgi:UDP-glucose:(heptosyl)LPS alpha-1,3-glucosyltransferase|nr:glycosyltransferase family 4 protein [Candidatus Binatia bacterium]
MKIALTIEGFAPSQGGGEGYVVNLARQLARRGHQVHVFAHAGEAGDIPVTFHRVPMNKGSEVLRTLSFARNCRQQLREHDFDIVQGFGKTWGMDVFRPGGGVHRAWLGQDLKSIGNLPYRLYRRGQRLLSFKDTVFFFLKPGNTAAQA